VPFRPDPFSLLSTGHHQIRIVQNVLNDTDQATWEKFVDLGGRSAQRLGMARSLGQIWAALYLSPRPLTLQDLMDCLHISKGGASMSVRQLAEWNAVSRVWVKGDRRDFYEANPEFTQILRHLLTVFLKPRLASTSGQLQDMKNSVGKKEGTSTPEGLFMRERISKLESVHKKVSKLLPLAEKLL
jgi:DNA-binding transcriptional regulator GbsR (MarR family)